MMKKMLMQSEDVPKIQTTFRKFDSSRLLENQTLRYPIEPRPMGCMHGPSESLDLKAEIIFSYK